MLKHEFYLYHEGNVVFGRRNKEDRVVVKEFAEGADHGKDADGLPITAAQAAYDFVQSVINPDCVDPQRKYGKLGFTHPDFQSLISDRCKPIVEAAYAASGQESASVAA